MIEVLMKQLNPSVLVLNQFAKPRSETGGTRHIELFDRLRGWRFRIIAGDRDLYTCRSFSTDEAGFTTVRVSHYERNDRRRILNWVSYCAGAVWVGLRCQRPNVIYASSPHMLTPLAGWMLSRLRRSRFVLEVRDLWRQSLVATGHLREGSVAHRLLSLLERWVYRRADHIVIVSDGWRPLLERDGVDPRRVTTISNGAEPDDFRPDQRYVPLRERVPVHGRLVVYAGAHGAANNVQAVLDAAAELPEHTFVLIGDGMEKARLVQEARSRGLSNLHFLDMLPKSELAGILNGADIGLHVLADLAVFRAGGSPNKLYDYLAAGVPVVTNVVGEPSSVARMSGAGIGVSPDSLADGIRELAGLNESQIASMRKNAVEYMRTHKSRTVQARRLQSVLDQQLRSNQTDAHPVIFALRR
ncbi:glycosyltransferase family 4 protein [Saccharopolyspora mangrovi]|uniref:Glycosyltransferase family 4 protein n=1 Tax=Saccharopolyspora mangrovi TaxID=3082379 RepID=A0ABU6A4W0_9PSEU|nr:glycosyltransferase family 4 protein [Saccharopolyspora sp. S2-29]MEB3366469.1 glycosyltransferase family 4 protein [Saccharopolyspora sp. S2-29]